MKIFTSRQIKEWDRYTIEHEPVKSIDLMERAASAVADEIARRWVPMRVIVFAGPGNNGGDALAVARLLAERSFAVSVYLFNIHNNLSPDCAANKKRLVESVKVEDFVEVKVNFDPPVLDADTLVVDGLFGAGLDKPLAGGFSSLVKYINQSEAPVVSIDLPSGLMPEDNSSNVRANIVRATLTLTFQQLKLSMLFAENQPYLGEVKVLDIRLSKSFAESKDSRFSLVEEGELRSFLRRRWPFAHKGEMGHALLIAGSYGMSGAAILSARACLRSGVGKLSVHTPKANYTVMQMAVPEAVLQMDASELRFTEAVDTTAYSDWAQTRLRPSRSYPSCAEPTALWSSMPMPSTYWLPIAPGCSSCPRTASSRPIPRRWSACWGRRRTTAANCSTVHRKWQRASWHTYCSRDTTPPCACPRDK